MTVDQTGTRDGVPERFVPKDMRGQLIEAEHVSRYRWAASAAPEKRVLDAGCGVAYGTAILAEAGAAAVMGIDIAESVLESARGEMPEKVELKVGDLTNLDLDDDQFDLIVCFEVIEHFENPDVVLDELARVLAPGGSLLVSSPNREVHPAGNPHHQHEFSAGELNAALETRFSQVGLLHQQDYVTSAILSTPIYESALEDPLTEVPLYKLVAEEAGEELFTLAVAGNGELPAMPSLAIMASHLGIQEWVGFSEAQEKALQEHRLYIQELETKVRERERLEVQLLEAEQRLVRLPEMEQNLKRLAPIEREVEATRAELESVKGSFSWRITEPLRNAKAYLGRLRPGRA
jgi:SAM-dependent methyltransferase